MARLRSVTQTSEARCVTPIFARSILLPHQDPHGANAAAVTVANAVGVSSSTDPGFVQATQAVLGDAVQNQQNFTGDTPFPSTPWTA